jgi:hypothetical protein
MLRRLLCFGLALGLWGCASTKSTIMLEKKCHGQTLQIFKVWKKTFENKHPLVQFVWADDSVVLDYNAMQHGLPYDPKVYRKHEFLLVDPEPETYQVNGQTLPVRQTVVYVDPAHYKAEDFQRFYECLRTHHSEFKKLVAADPEIPRFKVAALVYGREADFVEHFVRTENDYYEIHPDGTIFRSSMSGGIRQTSIEGLSPKVKMPGRQLVVEDPKRFKAAELQEYRNESGQALSERFKVVQAGQ